MKKLGCIIAVCLLFCCMTSAWGIPVQQKIYFSKVTNLPAGPYVLKFSLWDVATAGDPAVNKVWEEVNNITTTSTTVSTYLGSKAPVAAVDFSEQYWVQIEKLQPDGVTYLPVGGRTRLNIVPYAMYSVTSETAVSGGSVPSVTAGKGLKSTVTANGDVTLDVGAGAGISVATDAVSIKSDGVTNAMLAAGAVTDAKITGPISGSKIDSAAFVKKTGDTMTGLLSVEGPQDALRLTGYNPFITFFDSGAGYARSRIQSAGGDLNLFTESYMTGANPFSFIKLANNGNVGIGSSQPLGKLEIVGQDALRLVGYQPFMSFYDSGAGYARSAIQSANGEILFLSGSYLNGSNGNGYVTLFNNGALGVAQLIIRGGADLAEPFDVRNHEKIKPGMILTIDADNPGKLRISETAYDRTVAGVVSGAGGIKPGVSMQQEGSSAEGNIEVALTGRVYCMADSSKGTIKPGDMLTTSDIPGHAMKVTDFAKGQGAIIGKAMTGLDKGTGLVLVLVTLQ